MKTEYLRAVVINDGFDGSKGLVNLCFDPLTEKIFAVHPAGFYWFGLTAKSSDLASLQVTKYLESLYRVDPDVAERIEDFRAFLFYRRDKDALQVFDYACIGLHKRPDFSSAFLSWLMGGSTGKLWEVKALFEKYGAELLPLKFKYLQFENALYSLDTAQWYMKYGHEMKDAI